MTKDDIKQTVSMRSVVERYGIKINRSGFCKCPFHSERTASMKIYKDSYYCFGCEKSGDVFTFVENIENCDFKTAFEMLGGTYSKPDSMTNLRQYRRQKRQETRQTKIDILDKEIKRTYAELHLCMAIERTNRVECNFWWDAVREIDYLRYKAEQLDNEWEEINNGRTS